MQRTAVLVAFLVACGAPAAPADPGPWRSPQGADPPPPPTPTVSTTATASPDVATPPEGGEYDPFAHPCASDKDCPGDRFTCGTIGVGAPQAQQAPNTRKYCLRKNSGDCCPPAPPPPHR